MPFWGDYVVLLLRNCLLLFSKPHEEHESEPKLLSSIEQNVLSAIEAQFLQFSETDFWPMSNYSQDANLPPLDIVVRGRSGVTLFTLRETPGKEDGLRFSFSRCAQSTEEEDTSDMICHFALGPGRGSLLCSTASKDDEWLIPRLVLTLLKLSNFVHRGEEPFRIVEDMYEVPIDGFPLLHFLACCEMDDVSGMLLLGTFTGDLCLA